MAMPDLLLRGEGGFEGCRRHQRHVAIGHHQRAVEILERLGGAGRGMAGAELFGLDHAFGAEPGRIVAHGPAILGGDDDDARHPGAAHGGDDMAEDRFAGDGVQHLGHGGFHARAHARRQNDRRPRLRALCHAVPYNRIRPAISCAGPMSRPITALPERVK